MLQERAVLCAWELGKELMARLLRRSVPYQWLLRGTVVELEVPYEPLQLFCLDSEGVCCGGQGFCLCGVTLRHLVHLAHRPVNLLDRYRLLLARRGNLGNH